MREKILVISEYFYPDTTTTSYYLTNIIKIFSENNKVRVICNTELKEKNEIINDNIEVIRIKENKLNKNNLFLRLIKFIISSVKLSWTANKYIEKETNLFTVTNPAFLIFILAVLKIFKKFNYTLLVYDVFPENLLATNIIKEKSLFYKLIKKMFDWAYSRADRLVVIGRDMEEVIIAKTNNKVPIEIIENWCDISSVIPSSKNENEIVKNLELIDKKLFLFAGNLGRVQGINNLIKAATLVKDKDFRLLFIGEGAMKSDIIEYIKNNPNSNIVYGGSYPPSKQNIFLNACDIAIVSLNKSMYGLGVPSKSYYNMAAEKSIVYIGDEKSEIGRVISENKIGWIVEPDNISQLANAFDNICESRKEIDEYGKRARKVVEENFSQKVILNKYKKLYDLG